MNSILDFFKKKPKSLLTEEEQIIKDLAILYEKGKDRIKEIPSMDKLILLEYLKNGYIDIIKKGIKVEFVNIELDDFKYIKEKFNSSKILYISSLYNDSKIFNSEYNLYFRTIHDYIHITKNLPFDFAGELEVYKIQSRSMNSQIQKMILFSEIVLQAAFKVYFGYFKKNQKIVFYENLEQWV